MHKFLKDFGFLRCSHKSRKIVTVYIMKTSTAQVANVF